MRRRRREEWVNGLAGWLAGFGLLRLSGGQTTGMIISREPAERSQNGTNEKWGGGGAGSGGRKEGRRRDLEIERERERLKLSCPYSLFPDGMMCMRVCASSRTQSKKIKIKK